MNDEFDANCVFRESERCGLCIIIIKRPTFDAPSSHTHKFRVSLIIRKKTRDLPICVLLVFICGGSAEKRDRVLQSCFLRKFRPVIVLLLFSLEKNGRKINK